MASFFVSRVDTEVDRRLEQIAKDDPGSAAAAARARSCAARRRSPRPGSPTGLPRAVLAAPRWERLEQRRAPGASARCGPRPRRRTPPIRDLVYVDALIGPDTVNTMPEETLELYLDHGEAVPISEADLAEAEATFERLAECGIDIADVAEVLETEGVAAFAASFDDLLGKLHEKADHHQGQTR